MQGRTTYGGLSAALCLKAAEGLAEGAALRSAQIAFVGPVGGDVRIKTDVLRRGKSAVYINAVMLKISRTAARWVSAAMIASATFAIWP